MSSPVPCRRWRLCASIHWKCRSTREWRSTRQHGLHLASMRRCERGMGQKDSRCPKAPGAGTAACSHGQSWEPWYGRNPPLQTPLPRSGTAGIQELGPNALMDAATSARRCCSGCWGRLVALHNLFLARHLPERVRDQVRRWSHPTPQGSLRCVHPRPAAV